MLTACAEGRQGSTDPFSILLTFTPSYPCGLERADRQVALCLVQAGPELAYPCSQSEIVTEQLRGQPSATHLSQRDDHFAGTATPVSKKFCYHRCFSSINPT
jgi:hypothetical protein